MKYVKNTFSYDYQVTTGVEFFTKTTKVNDKNTIKLQIWDTVNCMIIKLGWSIEFSISCEIVL